MNQLFVVRTPLQLLSAYILARSQDKGHYNHLILLNPRGEELWHKGYSVKKMSTDTEVWGKISMFRHRIVRRSQINQIKFTVTTLKDELLNYGRVDRVYLGADREFDNQLLVQLAGHSSYARLDDGVWSYSSPDRSIWEKIKFLAWAKLVHFASGIPNGMTYNLCGGGYGKAGIADYLFKPNLLQRFSPQAIGFKSEDIHAALEYLTKDVPIDKQMAGQQAIIFLGSTHVDKNLIAKDTEESLLHNIYKLANEQQLQLIYKPHPFEDKEKLENYRRKMPGIYFADFADPIEIVVYKYPNILALLAYSSSGLLYADVFTRQAIKSIALFEFCKIEEKDAHLKNILLAANIDIPVDQESLASIIHSIADGTGHS